MSYLISLPQPLDLNYCVNRCLISLFCESVNQGQVMKHKTRGTVVNKTPILENEQIEK